MSRRALRGLGCAVLVVVSAPLCPKTAPAHFLQASHTAAAWCGWTVAGPRGARPKEIAFRKTPLWLEEPENANAAAGPGDLVAVVESDAAHHPGIYLVDSRAGSRRSLGRGSRPQWSPDGKRIACTVWKSPDRYWVLSLIDVTSGARSELETGCQASDYRWAPDGKTIAVSGVSYDGDCVLVLVALPSGERRVLERLPVRSSHQDLDWSPDSRTIALTRFTEEPVHVESSDLWLIDTEGGRCRLTDTPDLQEDSPRWVDSEHILYSVDSEAGILEPRVLTLKRR